jgi:hypothetical protein
MATFADSHIGDQTQAPDMIRFVWTARIILVPALTAVDHQGGTKLGFLGDFSLSNVDAASGLVTVGLLRRALDASLCTCKHGRSLSSSSC